MKNATYPMPEQLGVAGWYAVALAAERVHVHRDEETIAAAAVVSVTVFPSCSGFVAAYLTDRIWWPRVEASAATVEEYHLLFATL